MLIKDFPKDLVGPLNNSFYRDIENVLFSVYNSNFTKNNSEFLGKVKVRGGIN